MKVLISVYSQAGNIHVVAKATLRLCIPYSITVTDYQTPNDVKKNEKLSAVCNMQINTAYQKHNTTHL